LVETKTTRKENTVSEMEKFVNQSNYYQEKIKEPDAKFPLGKKAGDN
jgi:hypothetical protein